MILSKDNYISAVAIPPGKTISDEMKARWWKQNDIAKRLWTTEKNLIDLIKWAISLTREMAVKLEYVFWSSAQFWLNIEQSYQLSLAKAKQEAQAQQETTCFKQIKKFLTIPVQLELLTIDNNLAISIENIKKFFRWANNLSDIWQYQKNCVFRKSTIHNITNEWVAVFTRTSEIIADRQIISGFVKSNLKSLVQNLKNLMKSDHIDHEAIKGLCNNAGVYYVFTPQFKGLPISALSRYYLGKPLIHVTDKGNRLDVFWFNLLHEIGHIAKWHVDKKNSMMDVEKPSDEYKNSPEEKEANEYASNIIIPATDYQLLQTKPTMSSIKKIADKHSIHQSLIYGRLCKDKIISPQQMNRFIVKLHT